MHLYFSDVENLGILEHPKNKCHSDQTLKYAMTHCFSDVKISSNLILT